MFIHTYTHTYVHIPIYIYIYIYLYAYMHIYMCIYIYIYTHTRKHIYVSLSLFSLSLFSLSVAILAQAASSDLGLSLYRTKGSRNRRWNGAAPQPHGAGLDPRADMPGEVACGGPRDAEAPPRRQESSDAGRHDYPAGDANEKCSAEVLSRSVVGRAA